MYYPETPLQWAILIGALVALSAFVLIRELRRRKKREVDDAHVQGRKAGEAESLLAEKTKRDQLVSDWRTALDAFVEAYTDKVQDIAASDSTHIVYGCQDAVMNSADFWSIQARLDTDDERGRQSGIRGMGNRLDDIRKAMERLDPENTVPVMRAAPPVDLERLDDSYDKLRLRIPQAKEAVSALALDHAPLLKAACQQLERASVLLPLADCDRQSAEAFPEDEVLRRHFAASAAQKLQLAHDGLDEVERALARSEAHRRNTARGLERYAFLLGHTTPVVGFSAKDPTDAKEAYHLDRARKLFDLAEDRAKAVQAETLAKDKDWGALDRRIWHAIHELELAFWLKEGKAPVPNETSVTSEASPAA